MPLPTKTDAVFVRPTSITVPEGKTERRELRTVNSKTFLHSEKAADGKEIRTCQATIGAVCYRSDDGSLRSIDTTIRDLDGEVGIDWAPYRFRLHSEGIGFDFHSREGGWVGITLTGIGGEKFDQDTPLKPDITDNTITFRDVRPGCDIVFKCLNQRVKTLRLLHDEKAPRTFDWTVASDKPELIDSTLFGTDAAGNQLELSAVTNGSVITETWTGKAKVRLDPATRILSLSEDVSYPVEIDPTVNYAVTVGANDGYEVGGATWFGTTGTLYCGSTYNNGWRFPAVLVPQGATISSATLTIKTRTGANTPTLRLYCEDVASPDALSSSHRPSQAAKTTAFTAHVIAGPNTVNVVDITSAVQEVVNIGGFASGNPVNVLAFGQGGTYAKLHAFETNNGPDAGAISITYTEAAGGTAGKPLMLLGCG